MRKPRAQRKTGPNVAHLASGKPGAGS